MANASEFGAIGAPFVATCTTQANNPVITFSGSLPAGLVVGSGIGIVGVGATDPNSIRYFPTPTHRARVTAISGLQVTLSAAPALTAVSADVVCDDSLPIQAAIDAAIAGQIVTLSPGTFVLGAPGAKDNAPLFLKSGVTLQGAGALLTTVKVCDRAAQIPFAIEQRVAYYQPSITDAGHQYPHAAAIVNAHHTMWHMNQPWDPTNLSADPLLVTDVNVAVRAMTIDGNWSNQPANFVRSNQTQGVIADPRLTPGITGATVGGGALIGGHTYYCAITYVDSLGRESGFGRAYTFVTLGASENALRLTMITPPSGAVGQRIYVKDYDADPVDRTTWPYADWVSDENLKNQGSQLWSVVDLPFQAAGAVVTISTHDAGTTYPYGLGSIGFGSACNSNGIFFDNVNGAIVENVNITGFTVDGTLFGYTSQFDNQPAHPVNNVTFRNMKLSYFGRGGGGITSGAVSNVLLDGVDFSHSFWAFDVEPIAGTAGLIENLTFRNCTFTGFYQSSSGGVVVIARDFTPIRGLLFDGCTFTNNFVGVSLNFNEISVTVQGCRFVENTYAGVSSNGSVAGTIAGCTFINNESYGAVLLNEPLGNVGSHGYPHWQIVNNQITFPPTTGSVLIIQKDNYVLLAYNNFTESPRIEGVTAPINLPDNAALYVTAYGNTGDIRWYTVSGPPFVQVDPPPRYTSTVWPPLIPTAEAADNENVTHNAGVAESPPAPGTRVDPNSTANQIRNFFKIY